MAERQALYDGIKANHMKPRMSDAQPPKVQQEKGKVFKIYSNAFYGLYCLIPPLLLRNPKTISPASKVNSPRSSVNGHGIGAAGPG